MAVQILIGDVLDRLAQLPDESVHIVICSPPYWGLRDYGTGEWVGGDPNCDHRSPTMREGRNEDRPLLAGSAASNREQLLLAHRSVCALCGAVKVDRQLGLEPTLAEHIDALVAVFREVRRVLRSDGTLWLNYGDCFATSPNGRAAAATKAAGGDDRTFRDKPFSTIQGTLKAKDLVMVANRLAIALQDDGWFVRQEIVWHKTNPMPESVKDRPMTAHEKVWLLTKSPRYFYDHHAVREPSESSPSDRRKMAESKDRIGGKHKDLDDPLSKASQSSKVGRKRAVGSPDGRNLRSVWPADAETVGASPSGKRVRGVPPRHAQYESSDQSKLDHVGRGSGRNLRSVWSIATQPFKQAHFATFPTKLVETCLKAGTSEMGVCSSCGAPWKRVTEKRSTETVTVGWKPTCSCEVNTPVPATVLDPFGGSGTVGLVADRMQRDAILIELSSDYAEMARARIEGDGHLLAAVEVVP